jgi:two-component system response regulator FixJ
MRGLELQNALAERNIDIPIIFITAHGDVPMSATAFKAGALDFLEKPLSEETLLGRVREAIARDARHRQRSAERSEAQARLQRLTPREREVMAMVVQGESNKAIARRLNVSYRTVETHRARVMEKMEAESLPALIRLAEASGLHERER